MRPLPLALVAVALFALTGCPDDKKGTGAAASASASSTPAANAAPPSSKASPTNSGSGW